MRRQFVFGYGSLPALAGGVPCRLREHRRGWDVAMDNRHVIPGYKVYVDPASGERPPVHVAYLSITPHSGTTRPPPRYGGRLARLPRARTGGVRRRRRRPPGPDATPA